jgi:excisionase family DNA binding protein
MTEEDTSGLMVPSEVADLFGVDSKTVTRWAKSGRLASIKTPGGHRRYRRVDVLALFAERSAQSDRLAR